MGLDGFRNGASFLFGKFNIKVDVAGWVKQDQLLLVDQSVAAGGFAGSPELVEFVTIALGNPDGFQQVAPGLDAHLHVGHVLKSVVDEDLTDELGRAFLGTDDAHLFALGYTGHAGILHLDKFHVGYIDHINGVGAFDLEAAELHVVAHVQQQKIVFVGQPGEKIVGCKGLDFHHLTSNEIKGSGRGSEPRRDR